MVFTTMQGIYFQEIASTSDNAGDAFLEGGF